MRFDVNTWSWLSEGMHPDRYGIWHCRPCIVGPHDAVRAMKCREKVTPFVELREPFASDLFLLSLGESPDPAETKIGGIPYISKATEWPCDNRGQPVPFICQFNFQNSKDLVGHLPGDILLLFGRPPFRNEIYFRWETISTTKELVTEIDIPVSLNRPVFYGNRWRVTAFPYVRPLDGSSWAEIDLEDQTSVSMYRFSFAVMGVQIGRNPSIYAILERVNPGERFLCMLTEIVPALGTPYPFLNHSAPIIDIDYQENAYSLSEDGDFSENANDEFCILAIVQKSDGSLRSVVISL